MQSAVIATAIPSVRLSVTRWYCTQRNEDRIMWSLLWGGKNTLVFWYLQWLGRHPLPPKMCAQSDPPPVKNRLRPIFAYNVSTVRASEKVQLLRIGSWPRAFQWAIDKVRTLPLSHPEGGSKSKFVIFVNKNQFNRINSAIKFLCVKTFSGKVVAESLTCWR